MLSRIARPSSQAARAFSVCASLRADAKPSGQPLGEREKAAEDMYIREHEAEQLKKLRAKLSKQQQEIQETQEKIEKVTADQQQGKK